jgi:acetyl-CoA C-acetyltransferase
MRDATRAYIAGVFEHPDRVIAGKSVAQVHREVATGALQDAGLSLADVDAYFCAGDAPGSAISMGEYLGLNLRHIDGTDTGGSSYLLHVGHAMQAIEDGRCRVALITLGGLPRQDASSLKIETLEAPWSGFEVPYGVTVHGLYALAARRHMFEFGTTSAQLAEIRVAASWHAQFNQHAMHRTPVSVEEVLASPMISDPLHRLDCCVVTDGGGALVVVAPEVARDLDRKAVRILGQGEALKHGMGGRPDLTYTGAIVSGRDAFSEARLAPKDIDYVSIYDSFTITVLITLEDLGFCEKGSGGDFVTDGRLIAPDGPLPFNTDGGGLCNNHPANRGGMTKIIEAVRQLRGEANKEVQVANCEFALAHGSGGYIGERMVSSTLIMGVSEL